MCMKKTILFALIFACASAPLFVAAAGYTPLITSSWLEWTGDGDLGTYLNSLFNIAVLVGSILAVLLIASAGLQYMTTDAITQKKDSISRIQKAVLGLLMLLGSYLLFQQINPDILEFRYDVSDLSKDANTNN